MGLDQYWHREVSVYNSLRDNDACETVDGLPIPVDNLGGMTSRTTDDLVGYLRKANAVHGWITDNLADGVDECQRVHLAKDGLLALLDDIETALDTGKGMEPRDGFFFGGTDKDGYWRQDLETTRGIVKWILVDMDLPRGEPAGSFWSAISYYYVASW